MNAKRKRQPNAKRRKTSQSLGVRKDKDGVMFTAFYPDAESVQIASDFNRWQPDKNPMKKWKEGIWKVKIPLGEGAYRYRFVVDGQWQHDPHNEATEPNPFNEFNSLIHV